MSKLLGLILSLLLTGVASVKAAPCVDLALVLAVDGSGSITDDEFAFQKAAIASALRDAEVQKALEGAGLVALSAVFWGDGEFAQQRLGWYVVRGGQGIEPFAREVETTPRMVFGNTDIGSAIWTALDMLSDRGLCAARTIINVSGDGIETISPKRRQIASLPAARARAAGMGVTVNALTVSDDIPDLADYYTQSVIIGSGAFVMDVRRMADFSTAIRRKLVREILPGAVASFKAGGGPHAWYRASGYDGLRAERSVHRPAQQLAQK